jgi:hypothetical protein
MKLPFILSDADWETLKPRISEDLTDTAALIDPKQAKILAIFRTLDLRVEWTCRQAIINRNLLIFLCVLVAALTILHLNELGPFLKLMAG